MRGFGLGLGKETRRNLVFGFRKSPFAVWQLKAKFAGGLASQGLQKLVNILLLLNLKGRYALSKTLEQRDYKLVY